MNHNTKKIAAMFCATLMVATSFCIVTYDDNIEEDDAFTPGFWAGLAVGLVIGGVAGWGIANITSSSGTDKELRQNDADLIASGLTKGMNSYDVALKNYENIWKFTREHWTRQSELAASATWSKDAEWNPDDILYRSSTYMNTGLMIRNSVIQLNQHLSEIGEHVSKWNRSNTYAGHMQIELSYGSKTITIGSANELDLDFGTVAIPTSNGTQAIYTGGPIITSEPVSIQYKILNSDNKTWTTKSITTVANEPYTIFEPDSYTAAYLINMTPGVKYFGNLMPTMSSSSANVMPSVRIAKDTDVTYIYAKDWQKANENNYSINLTTNGSDTYSNLYFTVNPEGGTNTNPIDFKNVLLELTNLYQTAIYVMEQSYQSAEAIWSIFNSAGESSALLTTLTVPENYQGIDLTKEQQSIITVLAMQQLAEYSSSHSFDKEEFDLTMRSMTLYCRGTVKIPGPDGSLQTLHEDVVFTPIFYQDMELYKGENSINTYGFIAIWGVDKSISDLTSTDLSNSGLEYLQSSAVLDITEIELDGRETNYVSLKVDKVRVIDPISNGDDDPKEKTNSDWKDSILIIMAVIGAALLFVGILRSNPIYIVLGIAIIVAGYLASEEIASALEKLWKWIETLHLFG